MTVCGSFSPLSNSSHKQRHWNLGIYMIRLLNKIYVWCDIWFFAFFFKIWITTFPSGLSNGIKVDDLFNLRMIIFETIWIIHLSWEAAWPTQWLGHCTWHLVQDLLWPLAGNYSQVVPGLTPWLHLYITCI